MLERRRVENARDDLIAAFKNPGQNITTGIAYAYEDLEDYQSGAIDLFNASGILEGIAAAISGPSFVNASSPQNAQDSLSLVASLKWYAFDFHRKAITHDVRTYFNPRFNIDAGYTVPMMQSFGWVTQAAEMLTFIWNDLTKTNSVNPEIFYGEPDRAKWLNEHSNPYTVSKPAWYTSMTTVDEPLWRQFGHDPDMDSLGAYWMLAQVWDDPNPAKVRNALLATREHNIGTTFIKDVPEGNRVYQVDEFLLLYDYDIRSVNMRRKLMGLPFVEVEDYIYDMDLPLEVLPFAKDDVFYPAYVKMCEELGVVPYLHDNSIDVRIDPETLLVTRV